MDLNLIFHVAAALVFLALGAVALYLLTNLRWARALWREGSGQNPSKVVVDWPDVYLKRFCRLLEVPFAAAAGKDKSVPPSRIGVKTLLEFFFLFPVSHVRYENEGKSFLVTIESRKPLSNAPQWEEKLSQALGGMGRVRIVAVGS